MDVLGVKIIVLLLIAALKLLSGVAPMFLLPRLRGTGIKKRKLDKIMAGVLCVGGGFLLATVFVHMIPEVRDTFATALKKMREEEDHDHEGHDHHDGHGHDDDHHDDYPYAELLVCLGFFTIYLLEAVVHKVFLSVHKHGHSHEGGGGHGHSHAIPAHMLEDVKTHEDDEDGSTSSGAHSGRGSSPSQADPHDQVEKGSSTSGDSGCDNPAFAKDPEAPAEGSTTVARVSDPHPDSMESTVGKKSSLFKGDLAAKESGHGGKNVYNVSSATLTSYTTFNSDEGGSGDSRADSFSLPEHHGLPKLDVKQPQKEAKTASAREKKMMFSIRNFLIVLALSVHSIFEGMAVGLQLRPIDVWKLFLAIAIHDTAIHFCIGMEMISGGIKRLHVVAYFVTLAVVTPVGVVIGILATYNASAAGETQDLVIAVLSGLAGGTLLYITFYEVLDREKLAKNGMTGLVGCLLIVAGFGAMAGLEAVGGHSHGVVEAESGDGVVFPGQHPLASNSHGHSHDGDDSHGHSKDFLDTLKNSLLKFKDQSNNHGHSHDDDNDHDHEDHENHEDHDDRGDHDHDDHDHEGGRDHGDHGHGHSH